MHWYKDCSRCTAGIYGPSENLRYNLTLGDLAMSFQAEVLSIKHCKELLVNRSATNKQI